MIQWVKVVQMFEIELWNTSVIIIIIIILLYSALISPINRTDCHANHLVPLLFFSNWNWFLLIIPKFYHGIII